MRKKIRVAVWLEPEQLQILDELVLSTSKPRSVLIRQAVIDLNTRRPVASEADYRRAYAAEVTHIGIDVLLAKLAPEHRERILNTARERTEELYER